MDSRLRVLYAWADRPDGEEAQMMEIGMTGTGWI